MLAIVSFLFFCVVLYAPRMVLITLCALQVWVNHFQTWYWPLLGFIFLPRTTIAYAYFRHVEGSDGVISFGLLMFIAVLLDITIESCKRYIYDERSAALKAYRMSGAKWNR